MKHRRNYWLVAAALGLLPLLLLGLLARPAAAAATTGRGSLPTNGQGALPAGGPLTITVYLPLISRPVPGIQGYVTFNGLPESGAYLELRFYNGQSYSTHLSTYTDSTGYYNFAAASLAPGQSYYVRYLNTGATAGRLWFWGTADINAYSAGGTVFAGNFDLGDVSLSAPAPGATVGLPEEFTWVRRPATPSDSYLLTVFDPDGDAFWQSGPLGYANGMVLWSLPGDFETGPDYGWGVNILSPDGGYGTAYYYHPIYFSNVLLNSTAAVGSGGPAVAADRPVDRPRP